jgi:MFS-type transporter involved in bile tolerance (Atg22 family)
MESILKADIFFFITSIFVTIVAIITIIVGVYFILVIRNFYKISKILKGYAESTDASLRELGEQIRNSKLFTFLFGKEKTKREPEKHSNKKVI